MTSLLPNRRWLLPLLLLLPAACTSAANETVQSAAVEVPSTVEEQAAIAEDAGSGPVESAVSDHAGGDAESSVDVGSEATGARLDVLPVRTGEPEQTTGSVPHIQTSAVRSAEFVPELGRRAYSLPGVENRESVVSLPGAISLWLADDVELARPELLPAGREFGHIHPDGSLHLWLPVERAQEVADAQWGELHPWVERDGFWGGVVMVWSPESAEEVDVVVRLIVDSYNFLTGASLDAADFG